MISRTKHGHIMTNPRLNDHIVTYQKSQNHASFITSAHHHDISRYNTAQYILHTRFIHHYDISRCWAKEHINLKTSWKRLDKSSSLMLKPRAQYILHSRSIHDEFTSPCHVVDRTTIPPLSVIAQPPRRLPWMAANCSSLESPPDPFEQHSCSTPVSPLCHIQH